MEATILINRIKEGYKETLGQGTLLLNGMPRYDFVTLEKPNLHNTFNVSSIPAGTYKATKYIRPNKKKAIQLHGTDPRTWILIHSGNYFDDSEGCILPGKRFGDMNADGIYDVQESGDVTDMIYDLIPNEAEITVQIRLMEL